MVISVKEVLAEIVNPLPFSFTVDFSELEFFGRILFPHPGTFTGKVENRAGVLRLLGEISLTMDTTCDSCGEKVKRAVTLPVTHVLTLEESAAEKDDELIFCEDGKLDLADVAADTLVLQTEMRILCKPDCKGVCFGCGAKLNEEPCRCEKEIDPRFEALRSLL
jgi:uncharacterized protein